jgi:hypothetical protein
MAAGVSATLWVWDSGLETDEVGGGGWTALLGPGLGLAPTPAYLAMIARRFARRAARVASRGGGDGGISSSKSSGGSDWVLVFGWTDVDGGGWAVDETGLSW